MLTVTVIVPYYNHGEFIEETIASLLAQTRLADRIVVVDDGSNAAHCEFLWTYLAPLCIGGMSHTESLGPSAARNSGIRWALDFDPPPDILICLDADDILAPGYIEMMVDALDEHPEALVAYSDVQMFGFEHRVLRAPPTYDPSLLLTKPFIVSGAAFRTQMWKDIFASNGEGWDTQSDRLGWEDYLFWMEGLLGVAKGDRRAAVHAGPNKFWYLYRRFDRRDRSAGNEGELWEYMTEKMQRIYGVTLPHIQEWIKR